MGGGGVRRSGSIRPAGASTAHNAAAAKSLDFTGRAMPWHHRGFDSHLPLPVTTPAAHFIPQCLDMSRGKHLGVRNIYLWIINMKNARSKLELY